MISSTRSGDRLDVVVTDDVDMAVADQLVGEVEPHLADGPVVRLHLDQTSFVDSSGLVALLDLRAAVPKAGGRLVLVSPSSAVQRLLDVAGLVGHFDIEA